MTVATYRLAIFDFDGTLADSFRFFAEVFNELADRHGFRRLAPGEGKELRKLNTREVMKHLDVPMHKLPFIGKDFIAMMRSRRDEIAPFPGAVELLLQLKAAGVELAIVSSNDEDNVAAILGPEATAAVSHFQCGTSIFGKRSHLRKVLKASGVPAKRAIYIGDQATDFEAARAERVAFGAVSWGYGEFGHLRELGPEHAFGEMEDIARLLIR